MDFKAIASADWANGGYLVQPRLVENRVYAYKAYPQTVEDELDRKDTRLVPSRQCLSTVKRPTALLACVYSRALATLHAVKKGNHHENHCGNREHHQPDTI